jgi:esterase/lipase superfamily enzyme
MNGRHQLIDSPQLGRPVHVWTYGYFGWPVVIFPSAAGFAHEWQAQGMIDALDPLLRSGRIKLYCPESNVAEAWTRKESDPAWRIGRHNVYERFITETLVPWIREDCKTSDIPIATAGCSLGGMYAANMALKYPKTFRWALCMSGRYEVRNLNGGFDSVDVYFNNPLAYVGGLHGDALDQVRKHTRLALVCGRGAFEEGCIEETIALGHRLKQKAIPCDLDIWGTESRHDWAWWKKQAVQHFWRRYGNA